MLDRKKCQLRHWQRLFSLVPLFYTIPYRKLHKEQAPGNPFGYLLPRDCKEEALTGNCTSFTPAKECLIAQDHGLSVF